MAKIKYRELFEKIKSSPKIKISPQAIRNEISRIKRENAGLTLSAAAYEFAKKRGLILFRYLDEKDVNSLQFIQNKSTLKSIVRKDSKIKTWQIKPSFGKQFINDANNNAKIYPYIFILENTLREIILDTFKSKPNWWNDKKIVSNNIQDYATRIENAEKSYKWLKKRGDHPIYYVGLYELYKIIERNWKEFKHIFDDLGNLRTWINESTPIRNLVAHNVKTEKEERDNIIIRTKYICTLVESSKN